MESISLQEIQTVRPQPVQAGWVYVSSLSMKTYKKSPLLRRWCELRTSDENSKEYVMDFFLDKSELEPTRRIHLTFARVVVASNSGRLTHAQLARIKEGKVSSAFFIDFPKSQTNNLRRPLFETRFEKIIGMAEEFPLGFIMVSPDNGLWDQALREGCKIMSVPREKKRERLQRWINRAWMRLRGDLSQEQFDEAFKAPPVFRDQSTENFFTINPRTGGTVDFSQDQENENEDDDDDAKESSSFQTAEADEEVGEGEGVGVGGVVSITLSSCGETGEGQGGMGFKSVEEMLSEPDDSKRHSIAISIEEIESVIAYVEKTRSFSRADPQETGGEWSKCCESDSFDCFKSIDEASGLVRTRTWAKLPGVPPQCLFHILYDNAARKHWDHHYTRFDTIWRNSSVVSGTGDLDIVDAIVGAPFGCANREFMEWRRRLLPDSQRENRTGKFVIYLRSWSGPECRSVLKSHVRAEVWLSAYLIQWWKDVNGVVLGSEVMVMSQIDIKGLIPRYLVNALSSSAPRRWVKAVTAAANKELQDRNLSVDTLTDAQLDAIYQISSSS